MLESLEYLSLQYQGLVAVPPEIGQLKNLHTVNVSHNPNLLSVSAQIASLPLKRKSHNICNVSVSPPLTSCLCVLRPPPYLLDNTHNICAIINSHTPCSDCHLISQTEDTQPLQRHHQLTPNLLSVCAQTTTISLGQHTQHLCSHHQSHPQLRLPPYLSDRRHTTSATSSSAPP